MQNSMTDVLIFNFFKLSNFYLATVAKCSHLPKYWDYVVGLIG